MELLAQSLGLDACGQRPPLGGGRGGEPREVKDYRYCSSVSWSQLRGLENHRPEESSIDSNGYGMSKRVDDIDSLDIEPFACIEGGIKYRRWRGEALQYLAGTVDESGSSLADHALDIDMGGAGAGAPAMPGGAQGVKTVTCMTRLPKFRILS